MGVDPTGGPLMMLDRAGDGVEMEPLDESGLCSGDEDEDSGVLVEEEGSR